MNMPRSDLRELIDLMNGDLSPEQGARVRERMASDRQLRKRWQQLTTLDETPPEPEITTDTSVDDVAAFLDGTLSPAEAAEFETRCWDSESLLTEVLQLARPFDETPTESSELGERLVALQIAQPAATCTVAAPEPAATENGTGASATVGRPRQTPERSAGLVAMVAVALCAVLVVIVWAALSHPAGPEIAQEENETQPQVAPDPGQQAIVRDETPAPKPPESVVPSPEPKDGSAPTIVRVPEDKPSPPEPERPAPAPAATPAADWVDVHGIVAARATTRDVWRGLQARAQPENGNFATFPRSRGIARGPDGMELVIDEDSEVSGLDWAEPSVHVHRGRVAFRNLDEGATVRFLAAGVVLEATARSSETTVSLSLKSLVPILAVHSGSADVGNRRLKRQQYVLCRDDLQVERVSAAERPVFAGWLGTWQANIPVPTDVRDALMHSDNLRRDVLKHSNDNTLPRAVADRLAFAIAPEVPIARLLNSRRVEDRDMALLWLIQNPIGDSAGTQTAWRTIARRMNNETTPRMMHEWIRRVRTGEPAQEKFGEMVRSLRHRDLAVRHVAISCLRHFTGRNFGYDPLRPQANRGEAIRLWMQATR